MAERKPIFTPPFRVSFPNAFRPSSFQGGDPKYSVVMLFYPEKFTDAHKALWKDMGRIVNEAMLEKFKKSLKDMPGAKNPFRKGEEKAHLDGYGPGCIFATASSKQAPGVVDRNRQDIFEGDLYPGCWARASVTAFAYDQKGNKGASFGLHNIQKLGEGENFTGRIAAAEDFGDDVSAVFPESEAGVMAGAGADDSDPMA
jgi:hypothetical protein